MPFRKERKKAAVDSEEYDVAKSLKSEIDRRGALLWHRNTLRYAAIRLEDGPSTLMASWACCEVAAAVRGRGGEGAEGAAGAVAGAAGLREGVAAPRPALRAAQGAHEVHAGARRRRGPGGLAPGAGRPQLGRLLGGARDAGDAGGEQHGEAEAFGQRRQRRGAARGARATCEASASGRR